MLCQVVINAKRYIHNTEHRGRKGGGVLLDGMVEEASCSGYCLTVLNEVTVQAV